MAMREFGTLSCWSGSKGSSVSPVHLTQERSLMPFPVSHPETAQPFRLIPQPGTEHTDQLWQEGEGEGISTWQLSPSDVNCKSGVRERMNSPPAHSNMSLWPLSIFTQLPASQDTQTVPQQDRNAGPVSASQNQPLLITSPVTNSQCRLVSKSHRLSSEQPSSLDPYSTSQLWKPKLPALLPLRQGRRTGNSCCWNEGSQLSSMLFLDYIGILCMGFCICGSMHHSLLLVMRKKSHRIMQRDDLGLVFRFITIVSHMLLCVKENLSLQLSRRFKINSGGAQWSSCIVLHLQLKSTA